jgi:hypothetical protein
MMSQPEKLLMARRFQFPSRCVGNILFALILSLIPTSRFQDASPEFSVASSDDSPSKPLQALLYSRAHYNVFYLGASRPAPTFMRQHFDGSTNSPFQPINQASPNLLRYRGAKK